MPPAPQAVRPRGVQRDPRAEGAGFAACPRHEGFSEWLLAFHGQPLRRPQSERYLPEDEFVAWHQREVFRGPARQANGTVVDGRPDFLSRIIDTGPAHVHNLSWNSTDGPEIVVAVRRLR